MRLRVYLNRRDARPLMQKPPPFSNFIAVKYWPTWIGIGLLCLLAWMPFTLRMKAGELLGMLTYWLGRERRYITQVNLDLCFPELDARARHNLVKKCFQENGIGLVETATGWVRKKGSFRNQTTLIGLEQLEAAQAEGRGILLIGAHFSTLDFGANLLSIFHPFAVTYRPHRNALFDAFMLRGRLSNCNGVFDRNDIRGAFRHLKKGNSLWYAPDQDYGPDHAVYAPFFGKQAATITAGSRFAAFNQSPVFLVRQHRVGRSSQYEIEFVPFPETFPSEDNVADATLVNRMIEQAICQYPAQYLWMHKRFKTQPGGKPESPYIDISTPNHRLTEKQYQHVMASAEQVSELQEVRDYRLPNDLWLRQYPGLVGKHFYNRHPAKQFDRRAKALRLQGFATITVDNFFRVPALKISAVTYFVPAGRMLGEIAHKLLPLKELAAFLARLHKRGFHCDNPLPDAFMLREDTFAILDPTAFAYTGKPPGLKARHKAVIKLVKNLQLDSEDSHLVFSSYAEAAGLALEGVANG